MADEYLTAALYGMKRFSEWVSKKVKKEIGVEKIKDLLYEYYGEPSWHYMSYSDQWDSFYYHSEIGNEVIEHIPNYYLISKKFWFIKWLVENEKIDYEKIEKQTKCKNIVGWKEFLDFDIERDFTPYEEVLMWLAIQDEPIEFLVSILK